MGKPLPRTSGIETYLFREQKRWMAYWLPCHWGFRGWGDTKEEAVADLKKRDPYKAAELAEAAAAEPELASNERPEGTSNSLTGKGKGKEGR